MPQGVLMLTTRYAPLFGGAAVQAARLAAILQRRGWPVFVVTARTGDCAAREVLDGIPVQRVPTFGAKRHESLDLAFALMALLPIAWCWRRYSILHVHGLGTFAPIPILFAKALGKKVVVKMTLRGSDDARALGRSRLGGLRRRALTAADAIVSISRPMSDDYRASGLDAGRLVEMPQGVDVERYRPASEGERRALRERLGLAPGPLLVFVGSVIPRKGADILIEAFLRLARGRADLELVIVGMDDTTPDPVSLPEDARFAEAQRAKLAEAGLAQRVRFAGVVDQVEDYLRAADVFVFPSRREGFGTAMVEAMAAGLPCVVGAIDGIAASVFEPGVNGHIVAGEDPARWAEEIAALLDAPAERERLGRAARLEAERLYAFERVADRYEELYESLAG